MTLSRRHLLHGSAGLAAAATLPVSARAQTAGPIRVGLLTVKTGPLASGGLAIARAEAVSELPVVGPLLKTRSPAESTEAAP